MPHYYWSRTIDCPIQSVLEISGRTQLLFWCDLGHALWFSNSRVWPWVFKMWSPFTAVDVLNSFILLYTESRSVIIAKEVPLNLDVIQTGTKLMVYE